MIQQFTTNQALIMKGIKGQQADSSTSKESYYSTFAIEQLIKVLVDPTLRDHHQTVLLGINYLVLNLGQDSANFLPLIIPPILSHI